MAQSKLLLADDDRDVRETLAEILESEGYAVVQAPSAPAALAALDGDIFQAVLVDAFAPGGGLGPATQIARKAHPTPVAVISGWGFDDEELAGTGIRIALRKPLDVAEFLGEVARMVGGPLDPALHQGAGVAKAYFAALSAHDWDGVLALCTEGVIFAGPQGSRYAASLQGKAALRRHCEETFGLFSDAEFRDLAFYETPGGVAARYLGCWTRDGASLQQAGTALFQIDQGKIKRIGVEMNQALLDRLAPR